ncbi:hypothetical protein G5B30_11435 [Sphingobacterium sp. SGG-5]|nr:hypothetical protein [Sphingobacterium sp. SGG-5]NGM62526.1 hypothetical protein [Sphingobacterium sp. SGG-5]
MSLPVIRMSDPNSVLSQPYARKTQHIVRLDQPTVQMSPHISRTIQ